MRKPLITRPSYGGLSGDSAYVWALFLAHEAEWHEKPEEMEYWNKEAQTIQSCLARLASVHHPRLEEAIKQWSKTA